MINLLNDLVSKLVILLITMIIITKNIQINTTSTNLANKKNQRYYNETKKNNIDTKIDKDLIIDSLICKLNAHIDEQTYLLSYYIENELNEKNLQDIQNNIIKIKKDASNKNIIHLVDIPQLENIEKQLLIYNRALKEKNKEYI